MRLILVAFFVLAQAAPPPQKRGHIHANRRRARWRGATLGAGARFGRRRIRHDHRVLHTVGGHGLAEQRFGQVDLRFGKILRLGRAKTVVNLDVYNLFNVNTVLTVNYAYATWLRPTSVLLARFAKIGVQFDF